MLFLILLLLVGWTALVWATNNKHDNMVRLLLERGASTSAQTAKGHTIIDFLRHDPNDNTKIVQIFQEPSRRESTCSSGSFGTHVGDDLFYQAGIEGFEEMMAENERRYRMAMDGANSFDFDMADEPEDEVSDVCMECVSSTFYRCLSYF